MPITQQQKGRAERRQQMAAQDPAPRIRLIAGPGTGKSFAVQQRVRWLLDEGVSPNSIYVVSFTRASSGDLKRRIQRYCADAGVLNSGEVSVSTVHSLALRTLRAANLLAYPVDPCVMDNWELEHVLDSEFSNSSAYGLGRCREIRENYEAYCGTGHWLPPNYIQPSPPVSPAERQDYQQFHNPRTQIYSCVLPGEIVHQCVRSMDVGNLDPSGLLNANHLIVDEYQDLNPVDLAFIDGLIEGGVRTFVTGDDDQSIYSFRYASPGGIQVFTTRYPNASHHELRDCFRCTPEVLETAQALISHFSTPNRIRKRTKSLYRSSAPPVAGVVHRWLLASHAQEAQAIARSCIRLVDHGIPPREIMVLISNRRLQLRQIEDGMDAWNVEYESPRANPYIDSRDGRFLHALLRVVCDTDDYVAHRLILGLRPHVGPATCNQVANAVVANNLNFRDAFYYPLPSGAFQRRARTALNHARAICATISQWSSDDSISLRQDDISNVLLTTFGQNEVHNWLTEISDLPQEMTLEELRDYLWAGTEDHRQSLLEAAYARLGLDVPEALFPDKVRIMTMHGAKGLDAGVVFIPGLEEDILPGTARQPFPGLVNEAARLLYVSITRARAACVLTRAQTRIVYGRFSNQAPSRFTSFLNGPFDYRDQDGLTDSEVGEIADAFGQLF